MEKQNDIDDLDGVTIETLPKAYFEPRESMWKLRSHGVGGKWQNI